MNPQITIKEAAEILRKVISNDISLTCVSGKGGWNACYAGNVDFMAGDWKFTFFNDCDELDYTDSVIAPDGRTSNTDDWDDGDFKCPLNELTYEEYAELEAILEAA